MMISRLLTLAGTGVFLPGRPTVAVHDVHVTLPQLQRVEVEVSLGGTEVPGPGVVRGGEVGARVVQHVVVAEREGLSNSTPLKWTSPPLNQKTPPKKQGVFSMFWS